MMKEGYIEQSKRKTILLLSDDLRFFSGIATISKEIVLGTAHRFNWIQLAAGVNHPEVGKIIDVSKSVNEETGLSDANVRLIPCDGYGNVELVRQLLKLEKPDAIFIFTDPRYWAWLFEDEREIRSKVPLIYLNIWDDLPYPIYNREFYLSCDGLLAISKQTKNINEQVLGEDAKDRIIKYVPHGVSSHYKPLPADDPRVVSFRKGLFGDAKPAFTLLYNARNIGRKKLGDMMMAWKLFCSMVGLASKDCQFVMHTDIVDNAGTDIAAIYRDLCDSPGCNIKFLPNKFDVDTMNLMYNMSDGVILISSNEGWGLSLTEALMTGKMIIAAVTGGMQDQMRFEDSKGAWINFTKDFPSNHTGLVKSHGEWAIPIFPSNRALCGSPATPYIYDDRVTIEDTAKAIFDLYKLSDEERRRKGMEGHDWAISDEAGFTAQQMCTRVIEAVEDTFVNFTKHPRSRFDITKVLSRPSRMIDYDPITYKREDNE